MDKFPVDLLSLVGEPSFLEKATDFVASHGEKSPLYQLLRIDEERVLCREVDRSGLQDSSLLRYRRRAHLLADALIDEKGNLSRKNLENFLGLWEESGRIFYPRAYSDEQAFCQIRNVLQWLCSSDAAIKRIQKFSLPVANPYLEHLIKVSLFLPQQHVLQHVDVRRSVLSACFCFLRQSVGSCFATAPAILIHAEQLEYFLKDMDELLSTARLKRVIDGQEFAVPSSPSWGIGDLKKNLVPLLATKELKRSPGLFAALEAAHLNRERLAVFLERYVQGKKSCYVDEFLEVMLREQNHLAKERWDLFKEGNRFIPHSLLVTQRDPQEVLCEQVERALEAARDMFRSMSDHPLLKTWEYSLASFSEVKMEFSRWNLYASLGFDPNEKDGLGEVLAYSIDTTIDQANEKIADLHKSYEIAFDQTRATEALLKRASSEQEGRRLSAEYQSKVHHMRILLEMRDELHAKGNLFVGLYNFLLKQYDKLFPEYFQEIYDAEMFDPSQALDEDSAAGFRLVYKHGRSDPSQWTQIKNSRDYIEALLDFFKMSEPQIIAACTEEIVAKEIPRLTDLLIQQLRSEEFLKSAFRRMKKAHSVEKLPGIAPEMLQGEKKPWAYISGGTMETLLKTYYRGQSPVHSEGRWVESAEDLLIFLLESLKGISFRNAETYRKNKDKRMLMHSPTHAFLLLPGSPGFSEGWEHDSFTYTWVRDQLTLPSKNFYKKILLSKREAEGLLDRFLDDFSLENRSFGGFSEHTTIDQWVANFDPSMNDLLDGWLFSHLPIYEGNSWKSSVSRLVNVSLENLNATVRTFLTSDELLKLAKGCFLLAHGSLEQRIDLHGAILESALKQEMVAPRIVFADTNWPHNFFAFAWGAASKKLRILRFESGGEFTIPISSWEKYLNGTVRLPWAVYTKPEQYS